MRKENFSGHADKCSFASQRKKADSEINLEGKTKKPFPCDLAEMGKMKYKPAKTIKSTASTRSTKLII